MEMKTCYYDSAEGKRSKVLREKGKGGWSCTGRVGELGGRSSAGLGQKGELLFPPMEGFKGVGTVTDDLPTAR